MRLLITVLLTAGLAACADQGASASPSATDGAPTDPSATPDLAATDVPSLQAGMTITGVLGADSVEGGCIFLEADDGTRYELIWPDGWSVSPQLELIDPDGQVIADAGEPISARGQLAPDMASTCQVGQIFEVTDITVDE